MNIRRSLLLLPVLLVIALVAAAAFRIVRMPWVPAGPLVSERPAQGSVRLFAIGDSGTGGDAQRAVASAMEQRCREVGGVDGLVMLGDIVYPAGVRSADDPRWGEFVWDVYDGSCLSRAPVFPVLGNHDYHGSARAMVAHARLNPRWRFPHRFWEQRFGSLLQLVAVDNWFYDFCLDPDRCAMAFLDRALEEGDPGKGPWRIAVSHYPLASASVKGGAHRGGLRGWLTLGHVCGRVDAYLAGHAHHLEHRRLASCGIEHFVSGGGGKETYGVRPDDHGAAFALEEHGFLEVEALPGSLRFRFFDAAGRGLYTVARSRAGPGGGR